MVQNLNISNSLTNRTKKVPLFILLAVTLKKINTFYSLSPPSFSYKFPSFSFLVSSTMEPPKTNLNSLVEQCLVPDPSSPPLLDKEGKKPYFASASTGTLAPYPSFMDFHISQTLIDNPSTLNGDYIGVESCLDLATDMDFPPSYSIGDQDYKLLARRKEKTKKEFPPPIPLLARTENLPSHMPWVLRRYYTDDGRLILREERVRHHEYFEANRSGGRLTLQLVLMDDDFSFPPCSDDDSHIECNEDVVGDGESVDSEEEEGIVENNEEGGKEDGIIEEKGISGGGGASSSSSSSPSPSSSCLEGGSKCLSYIPVTGSSPCIFGVPVPALRPVHS